MKYKYRHTNIPSLLQGDVPDGEEIDFLSGSPMHCDFHHIMNGPYKKKAEEDGCWIWLSHEAHMKLHSTAEGAQFQYTLKQKCQIAYERIHTREMWVRRYHRNYL